ncbi:SAM-dependent methyltransferase [Streptomyces sp. NPDC048111]|uniref:SAM-dependent methyltransferase n=1 Tax=Streptomyces sp. NPDC048111 TaxID=3365500 RepID=UPI00371A3AE2
MTGQDRTAVTIDTSKPHPARVYDWFLGGKDNYPVDEALARQLLALDSRGRDIARVNRAFMHRATRWLAEQGVRQFLDIGTGIPTEPNLHQVAQGTASDARIVYADNDPIVLRHAEALLRSTADGVTEYIQADVREPERILELAHGTLDFDRPVALSLIALTHFIGDDDDVYGVVDRLLGVLAPGSYLVLSQITGDFDPQSAARAVELYKEGGVTLRPRTKAEVTRFFHGRELAEPGVTLAAAWHPELGEGASEGDDVIPVYAGVARKG